MDCFLSHLTDINTLAEEAEYPGGKTDEGSGRKRQRASSQKSISGRGKKAERCSKPEAGANQADHPTNPDKNHETDSREDGDWGKATAEGTRAPVPMCRSSEGQQTTSKHHQEQRSRNQGVATTTTHS